MSVPEPLNPRRPSARRLAGNFTPNTPFHHPHLDPKLDPEDLHLVPPALFRGNLNWELSRPAVTNLHVVLELTDGSNELLEDFHEKIAQIDEVLRLWGEKKGASSTTTGEAQLGTRVPDAENRNWTSTQEDEGITLKLSSDLDTPGRADKIYLTDAVEDSVEHAKNPNVPSNLRTMDSSEFDGCYVLLEKVEDLMAALPTEQSFDFSERSMRRNSTPSNIRVKEWLAGKQYADLAREAHNSEPEPPRQTGPYETFWKNIDPYGPRLALDTDEGESTSSTSQ